MTDSKSKWMKNVILFLTSQIVSLFGSSLVQYAIMWHITLNTKSGSMLTISIICGFLPTLFITPFSGVWADRFNRKTLIILSDSFIAAATLVLAILFIQGYDAMWLLFLTSAIRSLGSGIQTPAVSAFIPQIVPSDKLTRVNAVSSTIHSMVMLVSPMISGALLTLAPIESIFFIDVVTAIIAVVILLTLVRVQPHAKAMEKQQVTYFGDLADGFRYIKNHSFLKLFFLFASIFMFLSAPVAFLTPLQVTRTFGDDVWRLTAIEITFSAGMIAGGLIIGAWGGFKNRLHTLTLASAAIGLFTFALGIVPNFWVYLAFMVFTGMTIPIFNTPATVVLQEKVDGDYLGRVFSVMSMISSVMMPLGMLVFGPTADLIPIEALLIGTGILLVAEAFTMLGNKKLYEAGKPLDSN